MSNSFVGRKLRTVQALTQQDVTFLNQAFPELDHVVTF
jgi:hypothetical protein